MTSRYTVDEQVRVADQQTDKLKNKQESCGRGRSLITNCLKSSNSLSGIYDEYQTNSTLTWSYRMPAAAAAAGHATCF